MNDIGHLILDIVHRIIYIMEGFLKKPADLVAVAKFNRKHPLPR